MAARSLSTHPCQGMGLAKRDLGGSTILLDAPPSVMALEFLGGGGFTFAFGSPHGKSGCCWDGPQVLLVWGAPGGCGSPFPGIFVPQPLEATEAL